MYIEIVRGKYTPAGTFGIMYIDGLPFCATLEKPTPAIVAGDYVLEKYDSPKIPGSGPEADGDVFRIIKPGDEVFNSRYLEIHAMNVHLQSRGCIGVGRYFIDFDLEELHDAEGNPLGSGMLRGVARSKDTMEELFRITENKSSISFTIS